MPHLRLAERALDLLDAVIVSDVDGERVAVRLSEVEAYGEVGEDPASHAYRGRTPRNPSMFGPAGLCHVYRSYGVRSPLQTVHITSLWVESNGTGTMDC